MKAFEKFIDDSGVYGAPISLTRKPVFRSSAIFPIKIGEELSCRVLFMGYWILKREISEIGLVYTLRDDAGVLLNRTSMTVNSPKAFRLDIKDILGDKFKGSFTGSFEIEVFSSRDMIFPYPAFVLEYYGADFSTCVHTLGRVYNDFEDLKDASDYTVPESGFDIIAKKDVDPFFAFCNGPIENNEPITLELINHKNELQQAVLSPSDYLTKEFSTNFIFIEKHFKGLDTFLNGHKGTIKIKHNLKGFFPRFLAGNFSANKAKLSITHTYYDCSELTDKGAYWERNSADFHDSSIFAPVFAQPDYNTEIVFYPIYSPSSYIVDLLFVDFDGNTVHKLPHYKELSATKDFFRIDVNKIIQDNQLDSSKIAGVFITKKWPHSDLIPNRMKFGLNISMINQDKGLSSNICFNSELGLSKTLAKKGTRKWAPIVNNGKSIIAINNSPTLIVSDKAADIVVKIFREADANYLERHYTIPHLGQVRLLINEDAEIADFLMGKSGWVYIDADNPFVNAWYFNFSESGIVAADHSF
jgi:hypothetical protein